MTQKQEEQKKQENSANKYRLKKPTQCSHIQTKQKYVKVLDFKDQCRKCKKYLSTQKLNLCFQTAQIQYSGEQIIQYFFLMKYSMIFFVILVLVYTLPLCLIIRKIKGVDDNQSIFSLSTITLAENDQLGTLTFFLLPVLIVYSLLFLFLSYKIRQIKHNNDLSKKFPTKHAILLKFPKSIVSEDYVAQILENWFYKEIKHNPLCLDLLPQLLKDESQYSHSLEPSSQDQAQTLASRLIQKIIFSYNYEQYQNFLQEIEYFSKEIKQNKKEVDTREIQKYLSIYNIKKNIAKNMSFLKYCVVIFKKSKYADYFVEKTTTNPLQLFFSPQKYRIFQDEGQGIQVQSSIFPTEIYWQKMHFNDAIIFKKNLYSNTVWLLCIIVGSIIQYALTFLTLSNGFFISNQTGIIIASHIVVNIILLLFTFLIHTFTQRQVFISYEKEKKSFIIKVLFLNLIILTFVPTATYIIQFPANIYSGDSGLLNSQLISLAIFILFSILTMYLPIKITNIQRDKQFQCTKIVKTQYKLSFILTLVSITFIIAPIVPFIMCIPVGSLFLYYFLEKFNVSYIYDQANQRGSQLIKQVVQYSYNLYILQLLSFTFFHTFNGYNSNWKIQDVIITIFSFAIFLIIRFSNSNNIQNKLFGCFNNKPQKDDNIVDENYSKVKSNLLMQYEDYNFLFNYQLKQTEKNNNYSQRMKIYQQLNTMSKTLSLSLKQKLFSNPEPIIKNQLLNRKDSEQDQANDVYFQYQQKIKMAKSKPKIPIPPLFKRQDPSARRQQSKVEMANFNSIFSDSQQKKKVKKTIKTNLKLQNQIKK